MRNMLGICKGYIYIYTDTYWTCNGYISWIYHTQNIGSSFNPRSGTKKKVVFRGSHPRDKFTPLELALDPAS